MLEGDIILALDRISDPGNLGTIIRTAYWFGVKQIVLSKDSADPYNPKVVRSTQGGIFHTNIIEDTDLCDLLKNYATAGYKVYLFTLDGSNNLSEVVSNFGNGKSVLVFGSEVHGISNDLLGMDFEKVKVEGFSDCESLNVAISAGIALYEFKKL